MQGISGNAHIAIYTFYKYGIGARGPEGPQEAHWRGHLAPLDPGPLTGPQEARRRPQEVPREAAGDPVRARRAPAGDPERPHWAAGGPHEAQEAHWRAHLATLDP